MVVASNRVGTVTRDARVAIAFYFEEFAPV